MSEFEIKKASPIICSPVAKAGVEISSSVVGVVVGARFAGPKGAAIGGFVANNLAYGALEYGCNGSVDLKDAFINGAAGASGIAAGLATGGAASVPTAESVRIGLRVGLRRSALSGGAVGFFQDLIKQEGQIHLTGKQESFSYLRSLASIGFGAAVSTLTHGLFDIAKIGLGNLKPNSAVPGVELSPELGAAFKRIFAAASNRQLPGLNQEEGSLAAMIVDKLQETLKQGRTPGEFAHSVIQNCQRNYREKGGLITVSPLDEAAYGLAPDRVIAVMDSVSTALKKELQSDPTLPRMFARLVSDLRNESLFRGNSNPVSVVAAPQPAPSVPQKQPTSPVSPLHSFGQNEQLFYHAKAVAERSKGLIVGGDRLRVQFLLLGSEEPNKLTLVVRALAEEGNLRDIPLIQSVSKEQAIEYLRKLKTPLKSEILGPGQDGKFTTSTLEELGRQIDQLLN